jgi:ankyrin repeat protein
MLKSTHDGQQSANDRASVQKLARFKRKTEDNESLLTKKSKSIAQHKSQSDSVVDINSEDSAKRKKSVDITPTDALPAKKPKLKSHNKLESCQTSGGLKSSAHGDIYQLKLLMLFLHRGIENKYKFKLATEREGVGAFDDVFFEYDQNKRSCLQAKHKLDEEKKITYNDLFPPIKKDKTDGEFAIQKYFISHLEAKLDSKKEAKYLEHLIICTNIDFDFKGENKLKQEKARSKKKGKQARKAEKYILFDKIDTQKDEYKLLKELLIVYSSKKKSGFYKFTTKAAEKKKIISDILTLKPEDMPHKKKEKLNKLKQDLKNAQIDIEAEKSNFLDKLVFAVNQPDEKNLGERIKEEVGSKFKLTDSDLLYGNFQAIMLDWFKEKEGTYHSDRSGKNFFKEAEQKLAKLILIGPTLEYHAKIEKFCIKFKQDIIQELRLHSFLTSKQQTFKLITQHNTLSAIIVYQVLQSISDYQRDDSYIFITLSSLLRLRERVVQAFESEVSSNLLVIECESVEENIQALYEQLSEIIRSNPNKKIILITEQNDLLASRFKTDSTYDKGVDIIFNHLTPESQTNLLEKEVTFQGEKMSLNKLIDGNSKELIDSKTLVNLVNNIIEIGNKLLSLNEIKYYYRDRAFNPRVVKQEIFKAGDLSDLFAISNISENNLSELLNEGEKIRRFEDKDPDKSKPIRFIILDSQQAEKQFRQLIQSPNYKEHPIHWLRKESKLVWQQSQGSLWGLRGYIEYDQSNSSLHYSKNGCSEEEFINEKNNKVVIIAAAPGMGKSTVLTSLSKKIKNDSPSLWVIRINLNDHSDILKKELKEPSFSYNNIDEAVNFLSNKLLKLNTPLEQGLFKYRCKNDGKVVLLFDGFDEISPDYKKIVIKLLQTLRDTKVEKLWVTTRPYMRNLLEDELQVISCTLKPFSEEDQRGFLKKFWQKNLNLNEASEGRLETYTRALLKLFIKSIRDKEKEFTGIPLQMKMLAEAFQKDFAKFYNSNQVKPKLPKKLDLLDLYEKFVEEKYRIYCEEKKEQKLTNVAEQEDNHELYLTFIQKHKKLAFYTLFSEFKELFSKREIDEIKYLMNTVIAEGKEKKGIIDQVIEGKPRFIHRTFTEYFAADFLVSWLEEEVDGDDEKFVTEKYVKFLLTQILTAPNYDIIRSFFNSKFKKIRLTGKTLTLNGKQIARLWAELGSFYKKQGQTALHVASTESNIEIIDFLLNSFKGDSDTFKALVVATDMYQKNALQLAVLENNDEILKKLLEGIKDGFLEFQELYSLDRGSSTILHYAALNAYDKCVRLLVEYNPNSIHTRDSLGCTPLISAAWTEFDDFREESNKIIRFLIESGADPSAEDYAGFVPLFFAAYVRNVEGVKILLNNGANPNPNFRYLNIGVTPPRKSDVGMTPLYGAVLSGKLETVNLLLKKGAKFCYESGKGGFLGEFHLTALHLAVLLPSDVTDRMAIIKSLLEKDISIIDVKFEAKINDIQVFIKKITDEANLDYEADYTWLNRSFKNFLINLISPFAGNLISTFVGNLIPKFASNLISKFFGNIALTAYDIAKILDEKEILEFLEMKGAKKSVPGLLISKIVPKLREHLIREIRMKVWNRQQIVREDKLARQALGNQRKQNSLHAAFGNGDTKTIKQILNSSKGDRSILLHTDRGYTVLHKAADRGLDEIVEQLLESAKSVSDNSETLKYMVKKITPNKENFLHLAVQQNYARNAVYSTVQKILAFFKEDKDSDTLKELILARDKKGRTPLHEAAAQKGNNKVVKELLGSIKKDSDALKELISAKDEHGKTPKDLAAQYGDRDVAKLLEEQATSFDI